MTIKSQKSSDIKYKQLIKHHLISIVVENAKELGWAIEHKTQNICKCYDIFESLLKIILNFI